MPFEDQQDAPSGISVRNRKDGVFISIKRNLLTRILAVLGGTATLVVGTIMIVEPRMIIEVDWWIVAVAMVVISAICLHMVLSRTIVLFTVDRFCVARRPWRFPKGFEVPVRDITHFIIDTHEVTRTDKHGNEYSSYTFYLEVARSSTSKHPRVYATSDEAQSVYLVTYLNHKLKSFRGET